MKKIFLILMLLFFMTVNSFAKVMRGDIVENPVFTPFLSGKMDIKDVPSELKEWIKWATYGYEPDECVFGINNRGKYCNYVSDMKIEVLKNRFSFSMRVKTLKKGYLRLVGSMDAFPLNVFSGDKKLAVVAKGNLPYVYLEKGEYFIKGSGKASDEIRYLYIPNDAGNIEVIRNGKEVFNYNLDNQGILRFETESTVKKTDTDTVNLTAYRKIKDGIPLTMTLHLEMNVSGKERTENLGNVIPDNFVLKNISSPFPAYIQKDGSLITEVRAGAYALELEFRQINEQLDVSMPLLSEQEIWVFEKDENIRVIEAPNNIVSIDVSNTTLPHAWRAYPAYIVNNGDTVVLSVSPHVNEKTDNLSLFRNIKLSFDGKYYSVKDDISADFKNNGRLLLSKPFLLSSAKTALEPVPITVLDNEKDVGVEVRKGDSNLTLISRISANLKTIKATGYNRVFNNVSWNLTLAPGYSLFHIFGADSVSKSWVKSWNLLGIFQVMVLAIVFFYLFGFKVAAISLFLFILMHPIFPDFTWLSFVLSAVVFVIRNIKEENAFVTVLKFFKYSLLAILSMYLFAVLIPHVKGAMYPSLYDDINVRVDYVLIFAIYCIIALIYMGYKVVVGDGRWLKKTIYIIGLVVVARLVFMGGEFFFNHNDDMMYETVSAKGYGRAMMAPSMSSKMDFMAGGFADAEMQMEMNMSNVQNKEVKMKKYQSLNIAKNVVQTGFGFPSFAKDEIIVTENGPVSEDASFKIFLISPFVNVILAMLRFVLSLFVIYVLFDRKDKIKFSKKIVSSFIVIVMLFSATNAQAEVPDEAILQELKARLTADTPSKCLPNGCISYPKAIISGEDNALNLKLTAYALEKVVAPLPEIKSDGIGFAGLKEVVFAPDKAANLTKMNGKPAILLNEGENIIEMRFVLDEETERFIFSSEFPINDIEDNLEGFSMYKVQGGIQSFQINRKLKAKIAKEKPNEAKIDVEPFFRVEREFNISSLWQVHTTVIKETGNQRTESIDIPLVAGENVISSEGVLMKDKIRLSFSPNEWSKSYDSLLPVENNIVLNSPKTIDKYKEIWKFAIDNSWSIKYEGLEPINNGENQFTVFYPTADKYLKMNIYRPNSVAGNVITFDSVSYSLSLSKDIEELNLNLNARSSEGGVHNIAIPTGATVKSLYIANRPYPISMKDGMLVLPINQGENVIRVVLTFKKDLGIVTKLPMVNLNAPAVDISQNVSIPSNRWVVYTKGSVKGPVVLFLSLLPVLIVFSWVLGRFKIYPMHTGAWFLLLLGLSQTNIFSNVVVVLWFVLMGLRDKYSMEIKPKRMVQIALGILCVMFVLCLLSSIKTGLLGSPEMLIKGNGSTAYNFKWYTDAVDGITPSAMFVSLPNIVYQLFMLLWAIWLAFSFVKWAKWGVATISKDGLWPQKMPSLATKETDEKETNK